VACRHAEKIAARHEKITRRPVIRELQELLAADPTFRMSVDEMIRKTLVAKPYTKRHLTDTGQPLTLINEVLTKAPEFSEDSTMPTPLGKIPDWTRGTPGPGSASTLTLESTTCCRRSCRRGVTLFPAPIPGAS
jgi:phosphatidylserine decarboxylase